MTGRELIVGLVLLAVVIILWWPARKQEKSVKSVTAIPAQTAATASPVQRWIAAKEAWDRADATFEEETREAQAKRSAVILEYVEAEKALRQMRDTK